MVRRPVSASASAPCGGTGCRRAGPSTKSGARAGGRRLSDRRLHRWLAGTSASAPSSHGAADLLGLNRAHICVRNPNLERPQPMRLEVGRVPDFADLVLRDAGILRHQSDAPVRRLPRDPFHGQPQDLLRNLGRELARLPGSRTVLQTVQTVLEVAALPLVDALRAYPHGRSDVLNGHPAHREEQHPRAVSKTLADRGGPEPSPELCLVLWWFLSEIGAASAGLHG